MATTSHLSPATKTKPRALRATLDPFALAQDIERRLTEIFTLVGELPDHLWQEMPPPEEIPAPAVEAVASVPAPLAYACLVSTASANSVPHLFPCPITPGWTQAGFNSFQLRANLPEDQNAYFLSTKRPPHRPGDAAITFFTKQGCSIKLNAR